MNIDTKLTQMISKGMIKGYIDFEYKFKKNNLFTMRR